MKQSICQSFCSANHPFVGGDFVVEGAEDFSDRTLYSYIFWPNHREWVNVVPIKRRAS